MVSDEDMLESCCRSTETSSSSSTNSLLQAQQEEGRLHRACTWLIWLAQRSQDNHLETKTQASFRLLVDLRRRAVVPASPFRVKARCLNPLLGDTLLWRRKKTRSCLEHGSKRPVAPAVACTPVAFFPPAQDRLMTTNVARFSRHHESSVPPRHKKESALLVPHLRILSTASSSKHSGASQLHATCRTN
jgi:hypothetical protein